MQEVRELYANPMAGPFVRFGGGYAVFPPNTVREDITTVLDTLTEGTSTTDARGALVERAWIGGVPDIHPRSTWHAIGLDFACFYERHFPNAPVLRQKALMAARLMLDADVQQAWKKLQAFILENIDDLSGWPWCHFADDPMLAAVTRLQDGTYWYPDETGTLVRIIGIKTRAETRIDYLTDSILRPWGALGQLLTLFAVVATSEDFRRNPGGYPRSMRASVFPRSGGVSFRWQRLSSHQVRTIRWRPSNNLCDPAWLAHLVAGRVVDAVEGDVEATRLEIHRERVSGLESHYTRQFDFILDTDLLIGDGDEVYFTFQGRTFRWINATAECRGTLTVGCNDDPASATEAEEAANRLLSYLVWEHRVSIAIMWGAGGAKRSLPIAWQPRSAGGHVISPDQLIVGHKGAPSSRKLLALALYREGFTSRSVFYRFLSFWKVLELALPDLTTREAWVNSREAKLSGAPVSSIPIYEYLEVSCRDAIAHVSTKPLQRRRRRRRGRAITATSVDPDNKQHSARVYRDADLIHDLARAAIEEGLTD